MANNLTYKSTYEDIGWSLRDTLDKIKQDGETKELKFEMLYKYGRLLFMDGDIDKAYNVLQQCSIHSIDNFVVTDYDKELYYWAARCLEAQGKKDLALNGYLLLLENESYTKDDDVFVNEILDRLPLFGDITEFVNEYKKTRQEEKENPKDLLGKVIKFLKENK